PEGEGRGEGEQGGRAHGISKLGTRVRRSSPLPLMLKPVRAIDSFNRTLPCHSVSQSILIWLDPQAARSGGPGGKVNQPIFARILRSARADSVSPITNCCISMRDSPRQGVSRMGRLRRKWSHLLDMRI